MPKKKKKKGKADLTTVLHIRELPHLHMKLADWFSFPTTNNKNPMIPSWSLVSIYNYSLNWGAGIAQLVVLGLAVHSVAGSILLWGHFPVEGIFPLELTWVQTPFPQKLLRMRV